MASSRLMGGNNSGCIFITLLAALFITTGLYAQQGQRRFLVVNSEGGLLPVVAEMNQTIVSALKEEFGVKTEVLVEWLDTNRFNSPERTEIIVEMIRQKYASQQISGIIAFSEGALAILVKHRAKLFPDIPIVHMTVLRGNAKRWNQYPNVYGAEVDYSPDALLSFVQKAHPGIERMVVVTGISPLDRGFETYLKEWDRSNPTSIKLEFWSGLVLEDVLSRLKNLDSKSFVYTPGIVCDGAGEWMVGLEAVRKIVAVSPQPVYSPFAERVALVGAVGGIAPDFKMLGPQAAHILSKVLNEKEHEVKEVRAPEKGYFNWKELRRWKVNEDDLPPSSEVLLREPSFWELYWAWMVAIVVVILLQSAIITALLVQRRRVRLAESALAENRRQLTHLTRVAMLGELSGTLSHEFSQPLASMLTSTRAAQRFAEQYDVPNEIKSALSTIQNAGNHAANLLKRLRAMIRSEAPKKVQFDLNELVAEMMKLMRSEFSVRHIQTVLRLSHKALPLFGDEVQIRQVLVNILYNACEATVQQRVGASTLEVCTLEKPDGTAQILISDHGKGLSEEEQKRMFDPFFTTKATGLGLGMYICRQIVEEHSGTISVENYFTHQSQIGGVIVSVTLPLASIKQAV